MGGTGSGWQRTRKLTVEEGLTLAVKDLVAIGALDRGWRKGSLSWRTGTETFATLEYETSTCPVGNGTLWLCYVVDEQAHVLHGHARLDRAPLRRPTVVVHLPIKKIRVAKLYLPPGATTFASRKAYSLTYRSCQSPLRPERVRRRTERLARQMTSEAKFRALLNRSSQA